MVRNNINNLSIITNDILVRFFSLSKDQAKSKIAYDEKTWKILKVKRGVYINPLISIDKQELSNVIFNNSYLSLETVLFEKWMIKQFTYNVQSVSPISKTEEFSFGWFIFSNYKVNINSELGITIDKNIRKATKERALLDIIYLKLFSSKYSIDSEIYIPDDLDNKLIDKLLELYWNRVKEYYLNNIVWKQQIF